MMLDDNDNINNGDYEIEDNDNMVLNSDNDDYDDNKDDDDDVGDIPTNLVNMLPSTQNVLTVKKTVDFFRIVAC